MIDYTPKYLVMVTAGANNNKYYRMTPQGDMWLAEYGRIGGGTQSRTYSKYLKRIAKELIVCTLTPAVCCEMMKSLFIRKNNVQLSTSLS